jgi:hypothetical protein
MLKRDQGLSTMLERRTLKRSAMPFSIVLSSDSLQLPGITKDTSKEGLCIEILTPYVTASLLNLLNKNVTLEVKDMTLEGTIKWYTVNNARYLIGVLIDKKYSPAWKQLIEDNKPQQAAS